MQTFSERLIAARKEKGMTQEELAQIASVKRQTISSWENGRTVPDIDTIQRLQKVLDCDLIQNDDAPAHPGPSNHEAPPAPEPPAPEPVDAPQAPERVKPSKTPWIIAGIAVAACVVLACLLLFGRNGTPKVDQAGFNADFYRQEVPNEPGKAYLAFRNKTWEESTENNAFQRYAFGLNEQNGVGFSVSRVEVTLEGPGGELRTATLKAEDLKNAGYNPDIAPYGDMTIDGGFPKDEWVRAGMAVFGRDANGEALTFYSLIEF